MSDYIPRTGSKAHIAVTYFQKNSDQQMSLAQLAGLMGVHVTQVSSLLNRAERAHLLSKRIVGNSLFWTLGARKIPYLDLPNSSDADTDRPPETDDDQVESEFTFALWNDGELHINGAQATDGGVLLNTKQTAELVAYLTSTADYVEYLGRQAPK